MPWSGSALTDTPESKLFAAVHRSVKLGEAVLRSLYKLKRIAIIAALKREIQPLVKHWPSARVRHDEREFTFYESEHAVATCGGIGGEYARRAAEAAVARYSPQILISAGIAGALGPDLKVGDTIFPACVIDVRDSSRHETAIQKAAIAGSPLSRTLLVSHTEIASMAQKHQLAKSYGAHAVDMEAADVARAAELHLLPFIAVKTISDELDMALPEMQQFIRGGNFRMRRFVTFVAVRPWLWLPVIRLARNTGIASDNLCSWLRESVLTNTIVPGLPETGTGVGTK
jgi:nucleoside phosphorylase